MVGHRRTVSSASAASAASADSTTSTVVTVSDVQQSMDIDTLIEAGRCRSAELRNHDTVDHQQLAIRN